MKKVIGFIGGGLLIIGLVIYFFGLPIVQQLPDHEYSPEIAQALYPKQNGPIIYVDEGHLNLHTLENRWLATGKLLEKDGYQVSSFKRELTRDNIRECKIFIIANATHENNLARTKPTTPAFTQEEVAIIKNWVLDGGSLLLIADHMPFAGAINSLAKEFGFLFENGHAVNKQGRPDLFTKANGNLTDNAITNNNRFKHLDSIVTFSGSAFKVPKEATIVLELDTNWVSYNVNKAWEMEDVKPISLNGYAQGAYRNFGNGKVAIFEESAMFSATRAAILSWKKLGMGSYSGRHNYKLLLNTIAWLDNK